MLHYNILNTFMGMQLVRLIKIATDGWASLAWLYRSSVLWISITTVVN